MNCSLLPQHQRLLDASAINREVAEARQYRSVQTKAEVKRLGFSDRQSRMPALLIPVWNVYGEIATYQIRPDEPRIRKGKAVKYETPTGSKMVLDAPPMVRTKLGDPSIPLFITEGVRKADSAVSKGLCCIDVLGVWNFRGTNEHGGKTALGDWEAIALKSKSGSRKIYLVFDSDVWEKPEVHKALSRLKRFLESRGAEVFIVRLSPDDGGKKIGLDDFFAQGGTVESLLRTAETEFGEPSKENSPGHPYRATKDGLVYDKPTQEGGIPVRLTNFTAQIVQDTTLDDGVETRREFAIRARVAGREEMCLSIPANRFAGMNWPMEHLGAGAIIYPVPSIRDHARCAIQHLSEEVEQLTVFSHSGWRKVDGEHLYLHAGGAIGQDGLREVVRVQLQTALSGFRLPESPSGEPLRHAVQRSLTLLDVAPDRVAFPLFAGIYRAAIGDVDLSLFLAGPTGEGKSELAARAQQQFGAEMEARNLPANWSSTPNSLEALAFEAKDALLVVDDFAPTGTSYDVQRLHAAADRLMRAQGNRSGRQRMRSDGGLRQPRPPRGLILATGEDVPRGHSLRARVVVTELAPGDLNWSLLSECQQDGADGVYARALSGFLSWVARRREEVLRTSWTSTERYRSAGFGGPRAHRRSASNLASLASAFDVFLGFAEEAGAVAGTRADELRARALAVFRALAEEQTRLQESQEPTRQFFELLAAAIANGRAHVAAADGKDPEAPNAWGWRKIQRPSDSATSWEARGELVGWIESGGDLFLEPCASLAVAKRIGIETGEPLGIGERTLRRRLKEKGLLVSCDHERLTVRRELQGQRRRVTHTHSKFLFPPSSGNWTNWSEDELSPDGETASPGPVRSGTGPGTGPGGPVPVQPGPVGGPVEISTGPEDPLAAGAVREPVDRLVQSKTTATTPQWEEGEL